MIERDFLMCRFGKFGVSWVMRTGAVCEEPARSWRAWWTGKCTGICSSPVYYYYYSDSCRVIDFERFISNKCKEKFRLIKKLTIFFEGLYQVKDYYKKIDINWESLEEEKFIEEVWRSTWGAPELLWAGRAPGDRGKEPPACCTRLRALFNVLFLFYQHRKSAESLANFVWRDCGSSQWKAEGVRVQSAMPTAESDAHFRSEPDRTSSGTLWTACRLGGSSRTTPTFTCASSSHSAQSCPLSTSDILASWSSPWRRWTPDRLACHSGGSSSLNGLHT